MAFRRALIAVLLLCAAGCGEGENPMAENSASAADTLSATEPAPTRTEISIDIAGFSSRPYWAPASVVNVEGGRQLTTGAGSGAFSAVLDLPEEARVKGPGIVRLKLRVTKGALLLVMVVPGDSAAFKSEHVLAEEWPEDQSLDIQVAELDQPLSILFSNGSEAGASEAIIKSVQVLPGAKPVQVGPEAKVNP